MKTPVVLLLLFALTVLGCDGSVERSVILDGPIMETVTETGELEYNGALINVSDKSVSSVLVVIILKDEDGEVIEIKSIGTDDEFESTNLMPGESVFFTLSFDVNPDMVIAKEVEIYYDE